MVVLITAGCHKLLCETTRPETTARRQQGIRGDVNPEPRNQSLDPRDHIGLPLTAPESITLEQRIPWIATG